MKKLLSILIFTLVYNAVSAQSLSDTILVATDKTNSAVTKYFVLGGTREMVVYQSKEKCDTTFYDDLSDYTKEAYYKELKLIKIRQKHISKIDADEVFDYFSIGDSIVNVTKHLGNKKLHVTPRGYEVAFYNNKRKKNEIFEFFFINGKLSSIGRSATKSLPTNDVWLAFKLIPFKEEMNNLEHFIKKLKKMK